LRLKSIEEVQEFIRELFKGKKVRVYLFGSRARGDFNERSDYDLAFLSDEDISTELSILEEVLEESYIPQRFDLVNLKFAGRELRRAVEREGILWVETEGERSSERL
jgi:predicted nucleotidyltransferase